MRVVGGIAKGRRLHATRAREMRPTTDTTRRTIFDILGDVSGAHVLDLFAGAGTLGIEALSRGARACVFVENDRAACSVILRNLEATDLRSSASIVRSDAIRFLSKRSRDPFDLVFLDPPYGRGLGFVARALGKLDAGQWVQEGGTVVVESEMGSVDWPSGFREIRSRRFGRTQVSLAVGRWGAR